jgi:hypothetical protein
MNKLLIYVGCMILLLGAFPTGKAQLLSPTAHLTGEISTPTIAVYIGETTLSGNFPGYPLDSLLNYTTFEDVLDNPVIRDVIDTSLLENHSGFPLLGPCSFENVNTVKIIDIQTFEQVDFESLTREDILQLQQSIESFSNAVIICEQGSFLFGIPEQNIITNSDLHYALSSTVEFEIQEGITIPFLVTLTTSPVELLYLGGTGFLLPGFGNGDAMIYDSQGNIIWDKNISNKIFLIEDPRISITQNAPVNLFPLYPQKEQDIVNLSIFPTQQQFIDLPVILEKVPQEIEQFEDIELSTITNEIQGYDALLSAASEILNGGMILINTNDTVTIDHSSQSFAGFGFARGDRIDVTITSTEVPKATIEGDYELIFLGDHLYTSQAKESKNGVSLPYQLIIVWALALFFYFLLRFYLKKETNIELNNKLKTYTRVFHLVAIPITFILMDREISYQFGISLLDVVLGHTIPSFLLIFLMAELMIWALGYLFLAIPVRLITNSGLQMIGIGKSGKDIGKGIGVISIWFFSAFYIKLILNIMFLMINPSSLFPMG